MFEEFCKECDDYRLHSEQRYQEILSKHQSKVVEDEEHIISTKVPQTRVSSVVDLEKEGSNS